MAEQVWGRFLELGAQDWLDFDETESWLDRPNVLHNELLVTTLADLARNQLRLDAGELLARDAEGTKTFQYDLVLGFLREALAAAKSQGTLPGPVLSAACASAELEDLLARLIIDEIGTVIKAHQLRHEPDRYIRSEQALSRLHAVLSEPERAVVFEVFRRYDDSVFERDGLLDSDDMALTLIRHLSAPLWEGRRKSRGCDYLFVDEVQLFNENELHILPKLTKRASRNLPIALAIDQAQDTSARSTSGLGKLGIEDVENRTLHTVHRCAPGILALAFYILQRTADLFGEEFPDFTTSTVSKAVLAKYAKPPAAWSCGDDPETLASDVAEFASHLRRENLRQVAIVSYARELVPALEQALGATCGTEFVRVEERGERIRPGRPAVVLASPAMIGGQEFDAVVVVGLEEGVTPPAAATDAIGEALEQQAMRSMYVVVTRAKYQAHIMLRGARRANRVLRAAMSDGLLHDAGACP
jgi:DNA helicase IV